VLLGEPALVLGLQSMPQCTGNSNVLPLFLERGDASVYVMRSNADDTNASSAAMQSLSMRSAKNFRSSPRSFRSA
jgi:hypothetical protein